MDGFLEIDDTFLLIWKLEVLFMGAANRSETSFSSIGLIGYYCTIYPCLMDSPNYIMPMYDGRFWRAKLECLLPWFLGPGD